jgi:hypothetical protein
MPKSDQRPHVLSMRPARSDGRHRRLREVLIVIAALWVPCALLAWSGGPVILRAFISDLAAQSRMLFVIPLLMYGVVPLRRRLLGIANNFITSKIVENSGRQVLERETQTLEERRVSVPIMIGLWAASCALSISVLLLFQHTVVVRTWYQRPGSTSLSLAGWWYFMAVIPAIEVMLFRWLWMQWLWAKLLYKISRLKLRLIATHPDRMGGLGFLQWSEFEYLPICLAIGTLFAGAIANRIVSSGAHISEYKYVTAIAVVMVLVACVLPLCVFYRPLLHVKREAVLSHGRIGVTIGRLFEDKWLADSIHWNQNVLSAHDVSGAKYFASIVENVYKMRLVPIGAPMVMRLAVFTLMPMIPVLLVVLPLDLLMRELLKMLLAG